MKWILLVAVLLSPTSFASDSEIMNSILHRILDENHRELNRDEGFYNLLLFARDIAIMESDFKQRAKNPRSTAKGFFQYIDGSYLVAKIRIRRMYDVGWIDVQNVSDLNYTQQSILFYVDYYSRSNRSREMLTLISDGNHWAMVRLYCDYHHTACGPAEIDRLTAILNSTTYYTPEWKDG